MPTVQVNSAATRSLSILPTTDGSGLGMESALQSELANLYQQTQGFAVAMSSQGLPAFTKEEILRAHQTMGAELLSFVYVEKERLAIFLFDVNFTGKFIVSSQPLTDGPENRLTPSWLNNQLRVGFAQLYRSYASGDFQPLPGEEEDEKERAKKQQAADETADKKARRLFRELSSMQDTVAYWGINLGMTRLESNSLSNSTVAVGGLSGVRFWNRFRAELGLSVFSYLIGDLDMKFQIPLAEKYLSLYIGAGAATVLSAITQNKAVGSVVIKNGTLMYGPGFSFDVPLVGAAIRGEVKYYSGVSNILVATYGVTYSF